MYAETNKQLTCGEFCYLPATLCPFIEKVASQNSAQKIMRGKNIENRSPPPKKKDKLCLEMLERHKSY